MSIVIPPTEVVPSTTPDDSVDDVAEFYRKTKYNDEMAIIRSRVDQVNAVASELPVIDEVQFVVKILPLVRDWFRGIENKDIGLWFAVAGGMNKRIQVVDVDTRESLFEVPSAQLPVDPVVLKRDGNSIPTNLNSLLTRQDVAIHNNESRVVTAIDKAMVDMHLFKPTNDKLADNLRLLVYIYKLYGLPLEELFGEEVNDALGVLEIGGQEESTERNTTLPSVNKSDNEEYDY